MNSKVTVLENDCERKHKIRGMVNSNSNSDRSGLELAVQTAMRKTKTVDAGLVTDIFSQSTVTWFPSAGK
jgi:hypothetical protein